MKYYSDSVLPCRRWAVNRLLGPQIPVSASLIVALILKSHIFWSIKSENCFKVIRVNDVWLHANSLDRLVTLCVFMWEKAVPFSAMVSQKKKQLARFNISYCIHKIYRSSGREAIMSIMRVKLSIGIRASRLQCVWTKNTDLAISPSKLFYKSWVLYLNEPSWWSSLEKQLSPNCFEQTPKQSPGSKFFHFAPRTAVILAVEIRRKWPLSDSICSHIPAPHTLLA